MDKDLGEEGVQDQDGLSLDEVSVYQMNYAGCTKRDPNVGAQTRRGLARASAYYDYPVNKLDERIIIITFSDPHDRKKIINSAEVVHLVRGSIQKSQSLRDVKVERVRGGRGKPSTYNVSGKITVMKTGLDDLFKS